MTVRINKPALNLREELTKAQGVVRYEQRQFWMDGLVENGTFDTVDGWVTGSAWTISGGVATKPVGDWNALIYTFDKPLTNGKKYLLLITAVQESGFAVRLGTSNDIVPHATRSAGDYAFSFTATANNNNLKILPNGTAVFSQIDNIAVFEVDENNNVIHSLPLGFKPLHVYEDGLIQREGDVHDYTVVKTGGAYAIKPAVQPTTTTETCVIAEREL
jgi:hypothetical protein